MKVNARLFNEVDGSFLATFSLPKTNNILTPELLKKYWIDKEMNIQIKATTYKTVAGIEVRNTYDIEIPFGDSTREEIIKRLPKAIRSATEEVQYVEDKVKAKKSRVDMNKNGEVIEIEI